MEKLIYSLTNAKIDDTTDFAQRLKQAGALHVRLNHRDAAVDPAKPLAQQRGADLPDIIAQFWMPSSNSRFRGAVEQAIGDVCDVFHGWLVSESTIIKNDLHPVQDGMRTYGFAQIACLTLPEGQAWTDWRKIWRDSHTQIAIDTQSNFEYIQNLVIEPLTPDAPPFVAIVEECFPPEAMSDPAVFFDAVGDPEKFQANLKAMMDSCERFIAPGTIDVLATSQYNFGSDRSIAE